MPSSSRRTWRICVLKTSASSISERRRRAGRAVALAALSLALALPSGAQSPAGELLRVEGSVGVPSGRGPGDVRPVPGAWVTLHRVGGGSAGPLDSARTDAAGRYALSYRRAAADSAVFFLSAAHSGITYFSAPLPAAPVRGGDADIVVYDTTSADVGLRLRGRHLVVGARDSSQRHPVVEVFEILNDTALTVVSAGPRPSWSIPLPARAQDFRLAGGDVAADAVSADDGVLRLFAPIAPGIKQLSVSYALPAAAFPLTFPLRDTVEVLEVLIEDPAGSADGALLAAGDTVRIEGRTFRRYTAQNAPANSVVRITMPEPPVDTRRIYVVGILLALGTLMLLALGRSVRRPAAVPLGWNGADGPTPEELARRIAALDAAFQRRRSPTVEERQEYERQRGGLKAQLTDALARHAPER